LTTNFNDLIARYASSATVVYTLQIFEKSEREREGEKKGVHICATRTLMIEQANEREEREQKKKEAMLKSHLLLYVSHSITIQL